jgi:hypothetical protein
MEVIKKLEELTKSGNYELACLLINGLTEYQCIKYILTHHGKKNTKYILKESRFKYTLHEHASHLFAYQTIFYRL